MEHVNTRQICCAHLQLAVDPSPVQQHILHDHVIDEVWLLQRSILLRLHIMETRSFLGCMGVCCSAMPSLRGDSSASTGSCSFTAVHKEESMLYVWTSMQHSSVKVIRTHVRACHDVLSVADVAEIREHPSADLRQGKAI